MTSDVSSYMLQTATKQGPSLLQIGLWLLGVRNLTEKSMVGQYIVWRTVMDY